MQKTGIEYLDMTWNPIAMRCTPVSAGCDNCWHLRMVNRLVRIYSSRSILSNEDWRDNYEIAKAYYGGKNGKNILKTKELSAPLKRKKPARIGVQFMGDLFHEDIPNEWIAAVFGVMVACPQHTFFVLTKRAERMEGWYRIVLPSLLPTICTKYITDAHDFCGPMVWPLKNVNIGVSVEDNSTVNRIDWLLKTPAAKRFVSLEPLLGFVNIGGSLSQSLGSLDKNWINWVVAGAETGPGARPCNPSWLRSVHDQCAAYGVPFFLKQINAAGDRELDGRTHEEMI